MTGWPLIICDYRIRYPSFTLFPQTLRLGCPDRQRSTAARAVRLFAAIHRSSELASCLLRNSEARAPESVVRFVARLLSFRVGHMLRQKKVCPSISPATVGG